MTIKEAILRLENLLTALVECDDVKLGIEALKRLQDNREDPEFDHWVLLPGETEE